MTTSSIPTGSPAARRRAVERRPATCSAAGRAAARSRTWRRAGPRDVSVRLPLGGQRGRDAPSTARCAARRTRVCPARHLRRAPTRATGDPEDLAGVEVGVGYHSGSHYSAIQALEPFLEREQIDAGLRRPPVRPGALALAGRDRRGQRVGRAAYMLEQRGFRKLVDTTFMMGFLRPPRRRPGRPRALLPCAAARAAGDRPGAAPLHPALGARDARGPARARRRPPLRAGRAHRAAALYARDVRPHAGLDARAGSCSTSSRARRRRTRRPCSA